MASVCFLDEKPSEIDYSCVDNRIRSFTLDGTTLFDEDLGIAVDGWKDKLVKFVKDIGLDVDHGSGFHAFIYGLVDEGLIETLYCPKHIVIL